MARPKESQKMSSSHKDMHGLIIGSVAKVNSKRAVVINRGSNHGVRIGQRFQILSKDGDAITDPESGEIIELIPYEKSRVEVEELYENAAVALTYETHFVGGSIGISAGLADVFGPRREVYETFKAEVTPVDDSDRDLTVRVGDRVRQIPDND